MNITQDKIIPLSEAVKKYVFSGCHLSIGGFTISRNPMAAVYEIIRQKIDTIHLYAHSNGQGVDELIGAGCVSRLEIAYAGSGRFAPTCIRFKKAVQSGTIAIEDYSNYQMTLRFMAGAMGVPFLPTRSSLGTDIIEKWGFSRQMRAEDPRLPDEKLVIVDNPFGSWGNAPKLVLVPAINCDVTILHVQKADREGTVRMEGLTFSDIEQAKCARHVIVTCDEILSSDVLKAGPDQNQIPSFCVDAVVHIPYGAYPTACYRYYDYDPAYLNEYRKNAENDRMYKTYLEEFIYGVSGHPQLLDKIGTEQLKAIQADPRTGYAVGLDRR
jgi:glutaconate CoA-transferase subunit A